MRSISELEDCASDHLAHYTDSDGPRAFRTYDLVGEPESFGPLDALAPALLDAPVDPELVRSMFSSGPGPEQELLAAIQRLLAGTHLDKPSFVDVDLDADGPWLLVRGVLRASDQVRGVAAAKVTKMLHRKRPLLVPIFDSQVAAFYEVSTRRPWELWPVLQNELRTNSTWLADRSEDLLTPDDRAVSPLRVLDIMVWEHQVTRCTR